MFSRGNAVYLLVALAAVAGILASLGGGWFEGS